MTTSVTSGNLNQTTAGQPSVNQDDIAARRALWQQKREMMAIQKLQRDAQPAKNRADAALRSAFDTTSIAFDVALSTLVTIGLAVYKGFINKEKTWPWVVGVGLVTTPLLMAGRAVFGALTGKAQGQESSQRILASLGMPPVDANSQNVAGNTSTGQAMNTSPSEISSPLVNNAASASQLAQPTVKPQETWSVSA